MKDFKRHFHLYLVETCFEDVREKGFPKFDKLIAKKKLKERNQIRVTVLEKIKEMGTPLDISGITFTGEKSNLDPFTYCLDSKKNINKEILKLI